jgi:hypothetical protein
VTLIVIVVGRFGTWLISIERAAVEQAARQQEAGVAAAPSSPRG